MTRHIHNDTRDAETVKKRARFTSDVHRLGKRLHIDNLEDWYDVSAHQLHSLRYFQSNDIQRSLSKSMQLAYPYHEWDISRLDSGTRIQSRQRVMERALKILLPNHNQFRNYRQLEDFVSETNERLEIDVYFPDLRLGFEFQEEQHYFYHSKYENDPQVNAERDAHKMRLSEKLGISLVVIPYWWNHSIESLAATTLRQRPDLLQSIKLDESGDVAQFDVIPQEIPQSEVAKHQQTSPEVPGFGQLEIASFAPNISAIRDLHNWIMMEKYDGIRGFWHAERQLMYSRLGNDLNLPVSLAECMGSVSLEGEIWSKRQAFLNLFSAIRAHDGDWGSARFILFDLPTFPNAEFRVRMRTLEQSHAKDHPFCVPAPTKKCESMAQVNEEGQRLISQGGEGIMIRHGNSTYKGGLSHHLYKFKGKRDAEAQVIKILENSQYLVRMINVAEPNSELEQNMKLKPNAKMPALTEGDIVSFEYKSWGSKTGPSEAVIYKTRPDLLWQDVQQAARSKGRTLQRRPPKSLAPKTQNWRSWRKISDQKEFFDNFSRSKGFSPLDSDAWSKVHRHEISEAGGSGLIMSKYNGSLIAAIKTIYGVSVLRKRSWTKDRKKKFLDRFAKSRGFKPLDAAGWRDVTLKQIGQSGGYGLMNPVRQKSTKQKYSWLAKMIHDTYGVKITFSRRALQTWKTIDDARKSLNELAYSKGFDPLDITKWKMIKVADVKEKGGFNMLKIHGTMDKLLSAVFPGTHFVPRSFKKGKPRTLLGADDVVMP